MTISLNSGNLVNTKAKT